MNICKLCHVAISVNNYEWYVDFFENVFGLTIERVNEDLKSKQLWFNEGLQLVEDRECITNNNINDHIAFTVDDERIIIEKALENQCTIHSQHSNWIVLPNKVNIEILKK